MPFFCITYVFPVFNALVAMISCFPCLGWHFFVCLWCILCLVVVVVDLMPNFFSYAGERDAFHHKGICCVLRASLHTFSGGSS